ncbi:MAG TPA: hypothetical protein VM146_16120 [Steroidobacteraceae bacterium]|nr:hypothetical protein [Steroidobacteraceae bacterium]
MKKLTVLSTLAAALALAGCGVAETAGVAAAEAESAAEQIKEGKKLEEKVRNDIAEAQQAAADARDAVDP